MARFSQFAAFAAAIRQRESSDDYSDTKNSARLGAYQMGILALEDAGFLVKREGLTKVTQIKEADWTPYAQSLGVNSIATFRSNHTAQDTAFQNYAQKNWEYLHNYRSYINTSINKILITEAGLIAGAHLVGAGGVEDFLNTNGRDVAQDANLVPATEYMKNFSNYHFTFPPNSSGFSHAIDMPPQTALSDRVVPSATKPIKPAPSKPATGHTTADLDMLDPYEKLFAYMGGYMTGNDAPDWSKQAGPDAAQLNDQLITISESLVRNELKEATISPDHDDSANIPADDEIAGAPGSPDGSSASDVAAGIDRGDDQRIDLRQRLALLRSRRHGATGHRNDPIFIHELPTRTAH